MKHNQIWVGGEYACSKCHPERLAPCPVCRQQVKSGGCVHSADEALAVFAARQEVAA